MNNIVQAAIHHIIEYCNRRKFDWWAVQVVSDNGSKGYGYQFKFDGKTLIASVEDKEYDIIEPVNIEFYIQKDSGELVHLVTHEVYDLTRNKPNKGDLRKYIKEKLNEKRAV